MYLRYVERTNSIPAKRTGSNLLRRGLTVVLLVLGVVAAYEVFAFAQEYLRALGT